jgi:hypothetical protein
MQKIISLVLLTLVGCGRTARPPLLPTDGDFVKNSNGVGTAQVLGIDFSVHANSCRVPRTSGCSSCGASARLTPPWHAKH